MTTSETNDQPPVPPVNQFLLAALDQRWKNYRAELKRCRAEFSNEAVHDLRAAARRMLAFTLAFEFHLSAPAPAEIEPGFQGSIG